MTFFHQIKDRKKKTKFQPHPPYIIRFTLITFLNTMLLLFYNKEWLLIVWASCNVTFHVWSINARSTPWTRKNWYWVRTTLRRNQRSAQLLLAWKFLTYHETDEAVRLDAIVLCIVLRKCIMILWKSNRFLWNSNSL